MFSRKRRPLSKSDREILVVVQAGIETQALICAAKVDFFKEKHPELADQIDAVHDADPTSTKKYLSWGVTQLTNKAALDDVTTAIRTFHEFYARLQKKDIYQYKSVDEVKEEIEKISQEASKSEKKKQVRQDAEYLSDDGRYLLVHPKSMKASCHYGAGTKWCISATESTNYFNNYSKDNAFFYFLIDRQRQDRWSKAAIVLKKGDRKFADVYDAEDARHSLTELIGEVGPEVVLPVLTTAYKHLSTQGNNWQYTINQDATTEAALAALYFKHKDELTYDMKRNLLKRTGISVPVLEDMANDESHELRSLIADSESTPPHILIKLAKDPSLDVLATLASNAALPREAALALYNSGEASIRESLAANADLPGEILEELATLSGTVFYNKNASEAALLKSIDYFESAQQKHFSRHAITQTIQTNHVGFTDTVLKRLFIFLVTNRSMWEAEAILEANVNLTKDFLTGVLDFAVSPAGTSLDTSIILSLVRHVDNMPEDIERRIIEMPAIDGYAAQHIAGNSASESNLRHLFSLRNSSGLTEGNVSVALAGNKHTPVDIRDALLEESDSNDLPDMSLAYSMVTGDAATHLVPDTIRKAYNIIKQCTSWRRSDAIVHVAKNINTPVDVLEDIGSNATTNRDFEALLNVVANVNTPAHVLKSVLDSMHNAQLYKKALSNPNLPVEYLISWARGRGELAALAKAVAVERVINNPETPTAMLVSLSKGASDLAKLAKAALATRPDKPMVRRGRKPKPAETGLVEPVAARLDALADVLQGRKLPASVLLAVEEAADVLHSAGFELEVE